MLKSIISSNFSQNLETWKFDNLKDVFMIRNYYSNIDNDEEFIKKIKLKVKLVDYLYY